MPSLPARIGAEIIRLGRDRVARGGGIPRTIADLSPGWLSEALGADVRAFEMIDATAGTTSRARLRLAGSGVPASVFVKLAPTPLPTRAFVDLMGLGATEVRGDRDDGTPAGRRRRRGSGDRRGRARSACAGRRGRVRVLAP